MHNCMATMKLILTFFGEGHGTLMFYLQIYNQTFREGCRKLSFQLLLLKEILKLMVQELLVGQYKCGVEIETLPRMLLLEFKYQFYQFRTKQDLIFLYIVSMQWRYRTWRILYCQVKNIIQKFWIIYLSHVFLESVNVIPIALALHFTSPFSSIYVTS